MSIATITDDKFPEKIPLIVRDSVTSIFGSILDTEPQYDGEGNGKQIGDGVVGVISFVGDITWLLMLVLPRDSAGEIALKFAGFEVDYESKDMGDVVGELANVLAGDIVARLAETGIKVAMSLPTILRGHDVEPLLPRGLPCHQMHFSFPMGEVVLKLGASHPEEIVGKTPGS